MSLRSTRAALAGLAVAAAAAGTARAADKPAQVVGRPGGQATAAAYPAAARAAKVRGRAILRCKVSAAAAISDCAVVHEYPSASGFGQAALGLAKDFRVQPATHDGRPIDSEVLLEADWFPFDKGPNWVRKPSAQDLVAVFPRAALRRGIEGSATISCIVTLEGSLFDCVVTAEKPPGEAFGAAAIALTPQLLMKPAELNGHPVISAVQIPINFATGAPRTDQSDFGTIATASPAMVWRVAPSYADVAAAYPAKARAAKIGGRATLYCRFSRDGRLVDCYTVAQQPPGQGFADAAKALAREFRAIAKTPDGKPLPDSGVQLPVTFDPQMLNGGPPVIGHPQWASLPAAEEVTAAFAKLPKDTPETRVILQCTVRQGGMVDGCGVQSEEPPGHGVGQAALALAPKLRMTTWTNEGLPVVGGLVRIPIRYTVRSADPPPAKP